MNTMVRDAGVRGSICRKARGDGGKANPAGVGKEIRRVRIVSKRIFVVEWEENSRQPSRLIAK